MQSIPTDLRLIIFSYLSKNEAITFRRTCKQWRDDITKIWDKIFNEPFPQWTKRESIKWNLTKRGYFVRNVNNFSRFLEKKWPIKNDPFFEAISGNLKIGQRQTNVYALFVSNQWKYDIPVCFGVIEQVFFCTNKQNFVLYSHMLDEDIHTFCLSFWNVRERKNYEFRFDCPAKRIEIHFDFIYCSFDSKLMIFDARTSSLLKTLEFVDEFFISEGILYERFLIESWWKAHYFDRSAEPGWLAKASKYLASYCKNSV